MFGGERGNAHNVSRQPKERSSREDREERSKDRENGLTLVTWGVQLPPDASTLDFKYALADPLPPRAATVSQSQTGFSVEVNGETVWSRIIQSTAGTAKAPTSQMGWAKCRHSNRRRRAGPGSLN